MKLVLAIILFCVNCIFSSIMTLENRGVIFVFLTISLFTLVFDIFSNIYFRKKRYYNNKLSLFLCYNLIASLGFYYANGYDFNYGNFHGPYGDDSFFLQEAIYLAKTSLNFTAPFESLIAIIIRVLNYLGIYSFISVLIIYWLIPGFVVLLLDRFVKLYTDSWLTFKDLFFIIILNFLFIDIFVHLYRDSLIYCLSLLFLIGYKKKENIVFLLLLVILVFFLRGGNGFLLLAFVGLDKLLLKEGRNNIYKSLKTFKKRIVIIGLASFIVLFSLDSFLISHISRFENNQTERVVNISQYASNRQERLFENVDQGQLTVKIYEMGVIGYPLRILAQILSPITFKNIEIHNFRVSNKYSVQYLNRYIDFSWIFFSITILLWTYTLPRLVIGVRRMLYEVNYHSILMILMLSIVLVAFVSLQPRHRLMFIMYYPIIIGVFNSQVLESKEKKIFYKVQKLTILIVVISIIKWIMF